MLLPRPSAPFRGAKPSAALPRPSARTAPAGFRNRAKVLCPALIFRKETEKKNAAHLTSHITLDGQYGQTSISFGSEQMAACTPKENREKESTCKRTKCTLLFALGLCASKTCASAHISLTKIAETLQRRTLHSQRLARRNSFEWRSSAGVLSRFSRLAALQKVALARGVHIHRLGGAGGCDTVESGNRYMPAYLSCSYVASQKSASRRPSFFFGFAKMQAQPKPVHPTPASACACTIYSPLQPFHCRIQKLPLASHVSAQAQ